MKAFADKGHIHNPHVPQIRFGGDIALQPCSQRPAEEKAKDSEEQGDGQQQDSHARRTRALERQPG